MRIMRPIMGAIGYTGYIYILGMFLAAVESLTPRAIADLTCVDGRLGVDAGKLEMTSTRIDRKLGVTMVSPDQVETMLKAALPDAQVQVEDLTGTRDHYMVVVVSSEFEGKPTVRQHQMVYGALQAAMSSDAIHALTMKTYTPAAWQQVTQTA